MIDIIIATYNGEKYLKQQLFSLLSQTYQDWHCYIHDDGSTDSTVQIIEKFVELDSRFEFINDNIILHDSGKNFLHTLKNSKADFCCFCDQDDVWLDTKLEKQVNAILKKDNTIPQVIFSNSHLWNSNTNEIYGNATLAFPRKLKSLLYLNCGIQGCASIFNKKMVEILKNDLDVMCMHDYYLTLAGIVLGNIDYISENLMLYRQHGRNVTGYADSSVLSKYCSFFKRKSPLISHLHMESLKSFFNFWKEKMNISDSKLIEDFIKTEKTSFFSRFYFILRQKFNIYDSRLKLIIKFFLRKYI